MGARPTGESEDASEETWMDARGADAADIESAFASPNLRRETSTILEARIFPADYEASSALGTLT
jgi:hypothetical protein